MGFFKGIIYWIGIPYTAAVITKTALDLSTGNGPDLETLVGAVTDFRSALAGIGAFSLMVYHSIVKQPSEEEYGTPSYDVEPRYDKPKDDGDDRFDDPPTPFIRPPPEADSAGLAEKVKPPKVHVIEVDLNGPYSRSKSKKKSIKDSKEEQLVLVR